MSNKKDLLLILDTNFIIEHKKEFENVYEGLSNLADVYISRVTIQERKSQKWIEFKQKYDKIAHYREEISSIANIEEKEPFETFIKKKEKITEDSFSKILGDKIIEFTPNIEIFNIILDRVYKKTPPFIQGDSDKGLKDTMLWLSVINYFKLNKTDKKIIFISDDKGFKNSADILCREFKNETGLDIEIKNNSIYDELLGKNIKNLIKDDGETFSEEQIIELRTKIQEVMDSICFYVNYDYWGEPSSALRFNLGTKINYDLAKEILENIETLVNKNVLSEMINCDEFFGKDIIIMCHQPSIPIESIEDLNKLYQKLKSTKYINPFINEFCNRLNKYYDLKNDFQEYPF